MAAKPTATKPTGAACCTGRCRPNTRRGMAMTPPPAPVSAITSPMRAPSATASVVGSMSRRSEGVDRNFQVADTIVFRWWQSACAHVDLYRRQEQRWHGQGLVACGAHVDKLCLGNAIVNMNVLFTLFHHRGAPHGSPTFWRVVMA